MEREGVTAVRTYNSREQEIIRLVASGFTMDGIAHHLGIGTRTVKSYLDALRLKLGVATVRELPLAYMQATGDDPYPRPGEVEA